MAGFCIRGNVDLTPPLPLLKFESPPAPGQSGASREPSEAGKEVMTVTPVSRQSLTRG